MRKWSIAVIIAAVFLGAVLFTGSQWDGDITESAAEPLAESAGAEGGELLPWSIEGDLLLFLFLAGGAAAGFAAGYYWHRLFSENRQQERSRAAGRPN